MTISDSGPNTALARMLASSSGEEGDNNRQLLRALRLALGRSAQKAIDLSLSVIGAKQARLGQGDLSELLPQGWLAILLDGPQGQAGAICLDPGFATAIVQHQTLGQITGQVDEDRRFTATDAALVAPVLQHMLEQLSHQDDPGLAPVSGFSFGAAVGAGQDLMLALSVEWYTHVCLTVELSSGVAQGQVQMFFPEPLPSQDDDPDANPSLPEGPSLEAAFGVTRADLRTVLCRLRLPVSDLFELAPGDLLTLPSGGFTRTELRAVTGDLVAIGRLGQMNGQRAIRVNETQPDTHGEAGDLMPINGAADPVAPPMRDVPVRDTPEPEVAPSEPDAPPPALIEDIAQQRQIQHDTDEMELDKSGEELAAEISRLAGLSDLDPWEPNEPAPTT